MTGYDRAHARDEDYPYFMCDGCGLVSLYPLPAPEKLADFYPEDYASHTIPQSWDQRRLLRRLAIRYFYGTQSLHQPRAMRALWRVFSGRVMRDLCEPSGANRLLDVGCGTGGLMEKHRRLGWTVYGIEPSSRACAVCRSIGLEVHQGSVFDASLESRQFDVILLNHVIEHFPDPILALRQLTRFLAPGGKVVVRTPNIRGIGFTMYRSCWRALEAPRHLFLFDPCTIRLLADRAGLTARKVTTRPEAKMLCESRHYARTQGQRLPAGLAVRESLVSRRTAETEWDRLYRKIVSPLALLLSFFGRGDTLLAELSLDQERRDSIG